MWSALTGWWSSGQSVMVSGPLQSRSTTWAAKTAGVASWSWASLTSPVLKSAFFQPVRPSVVPVRFEDAAGERGDVAADVVVRSAGCEQFVQQVDAQSAEQGVCGVVG